MGLLIARCQRLEKDPDEAIASVAEAVQYPCKLGATRVPVT